MLRDLFWLAVGLSLAGCSKAPPPTEEPATSVGSDTNTSVAAAKSAALSWLDSVDREKYPESWDAAAKVFQQAVSRDGWTRSVAAARGPFGTLVSRQLRSAQYATSLPGAPDGKYVVIQFNASFQKAQATETITPMQQDDDTWKVSGYFIR
jgi:hypothetical protein